jgi:undecaprenyl pyrophosphate synthase
MVGSSNRLLLCLLLLVTAARSFDTSWSSKWSSKTPPQPTGVSTLMRAYEYEREGHVTKSSAAAPTHVAFIVDGNGRWATAQGLPRSAGHTAGAKTTVDIVTESFKAGATYVTLYLFSTENWSRPQPEISNIMTLLIQYATDFTDYLIDNGGMPPIYT